MDPTNFNTCIYEGGQRRGGGETKGERDLDQGGGEMEKNSMCHCKRERKRQREVWTRQR